MKISLIGFMGSGKSSVGKILSKKLSYDFIEMDTEILSQNGFKDMEELFYRKGESFLREQELNLSKKLSKINQAVISTGGGVVLNKSIIDNIKSKKIDQIVFLHTPFEILKKRIEEDKTPRPLFKNEDKAKKLFEVRLQLYKKYADFIVRTNKKTPEVLAQEIYLKLKKIQNIKVKKISPLEKTVDQIEEINKIINK